MPLEGAEQSYYPSAKVRLSIRFDEFKDGKSVSDQAPKKPSKNTNGVKDERSPLAVVREDEGGVVQFRLTTRQKQQKTPGLSAQSQKRSADGFTFDIAGIIPKEAEWKQNGIRTADTLSLTIKWADMPIDPRVVRACAVEFYIGTVSPEDFGGGIEGQTRTVATGPAEPLHVVPDTSPDPRDRSRSRSNLRFMGFVDKWEMSWSENEPTLKLECVDNTRLFIDEEAPPNLNLSTTQQEMKLDEAVAQYLSHFPQFEEMTVVYVGDRIGGTREKPKYQSAPTIKGALGTTAHRPNLGPPPSKGGGSGEEKTSVWDYLTDVCGALGHIVRVDGVRVIIQKPSTLLNDNVIPRANDTYRTRSLPSRDYPIRAFIYGQNVLEMKAEKQFTVNKVKNIEVRCFPGDTLVSARDIVSAYQRFYTGPVVRVRARGRRVFAGTPNHPVLTLRGWVPLRELVEGDYLVGCGFSERRGLADPHIDTAPTEFVELFDSLRDAGYSDRRPTGQVDFHGDGMESEVEVVEPDLLLWNRRESARLKHRRQFLLESTDERSRLLHSSSPGEARSSYLLTREFGSTYGVTGDLRGKPLLLNGHFPESVLAGSTESSYGDLFLAKGSEDYARVQAQLGAQLTGRGAFDVSLHKIVGIEHEVFSGHVFNLQTQSGWYVAAGVVAHNCYDPDRKQVLVARAPQDPKKRQVDANPGDGKTDQKWRVIKVAGIKSQQVLQDIADGLYNTRGRSEIKFGIKTKNLSSFGGGNDEADLFDIKFGDAVEILVDRDGFSTPSEITKKLSSIEQNKELMMGLGYPDEFAKAYADALFDAQLLKIYIVREMSVHWSADEGVSFDISAINFVVTRSGNINDANPPKPGPSTPKGQPPKPFNAGGFNI